MIISEEEKYIQFANEEDNVIFMKCDQNALNFKRKFGGKIFSGNATYVNENNDCRRIDGHIWNEINGTLVDIYSFKTDRKGFYCEHEGVEITEETLIRNNPNLL